MKDKEKRATVSNCCCAASVVSDFVRPHRQQPTRLPIPGILQARTLEWVAISFSNAWKWKVKVKVKSCPTVATPWTAAYQAPLSMGFSRQKYWSGVPLPSPCFKLEETKEAWQLNAVYDPGSGSGGAGTFRAWKLMFPKVWSWEFPHANLSVYAWSYSYFMYALFK